MELFTDKLQVDDRTPVLSLDVGGYRLDFLPPKLAFHVQICIIIVLDMIICAALGVFIYHFIITKRSRTQPFLAGFGVVLPLALLTPFHIINFLDIRSRTLRMGLACIPICSTFRCLEAVCGTTPSYALTSFKNYGLYCSSVLEVKAAKDHPMWATRSSLVTSFKQYNLKFAVFTIVMSFLAPVDFAPWRSNVDPTELTISIRMAHLCNNFVAAWLTSLSLSFSTIGVSILIQLLIRVQVDQVVFNPMLSSKSPSDFWGRRWNRLVHAGLKRAIYKPVRKQEYSKFIATLVTFVASGLLHEYVSALLFHCNAHEDCAMGCRVPPFGKHLLFFGWNGCLLLLEYVFGDFFTGVHKFIPAPIVSVMVILSALPVGHWFTGDMVAGGYFSSLQLAFPRLVLS